MLAAEKQLNKRRPYGKYEWSPPLERAGQQVTYWKTRLKLHKQDRPSLKLRNKIFNNQYLQLLNFPNKTSS